MLFFVGISNLLFVAFVGNLWPTHQLDAMQSEQALPYALLINLVLLTLFGLQHSLMARSTFKQWLRQWLPQGLERMIYNLSSAIVLLLLIYYWQAMPLVIWQAKAEWLRIGIYTVFFLGWFLSFVASNLIDGFQLVGLRQLAIHFLERPEPSTTFRTPTLYKMVRHPLYLGLLIAFWATPIMTLSHLLFASGMTAYILIGIHYEEKDLLQRFGRQYQNYQRNTPKLFPKRLSLN
ncbi:MAG: isoprenylcysteine carboxylmethyltransferase family protein [Bacteroidota bacterium]